MSHSTSVSTTNVNVYVKQTNLIGEQVGMKPLSAPSTVSQAAQSFEKAVIPLITAQWAKDYPNTPLPDGNIDFGYFGPWSSLKPGKVPQDVLNQVNTDLQNWQIPTGAGAAAQIAKTTTQMVYSHGGQAALNRGVTQAGANESIDWMLLSGQVYITETELGVCYVFAAALSIDIG